IPGAFSRAISNAISLIRPTRAGVARLAVGQQRHGPGGEIVAIELEEPASAHVFHEQEGVTVSGLVGGARNPVREERKLGARTARELHLMYLCGIAEARLDQHLALCRMPAGKACGAELAVAPHSF